MAFHRRQFLVDGDHQQTAPEPDGEHQDEGAPQRDPEQVPLVDGKQVAEQVTGQVDAEVLHHPQHHQADGE